MYAAAVCFGLSSPGWALQLSDLINAVRLRTRDTTTDTNNQQFSDQTIINTLNEGQRYIVNKTWCLTKTFNFDLVANQREYAMPSDLIVPLRVLISSTPLPEVTLQGLDSGQGFSANQDGLTVGFNWTVTIATPTVYFMDRLSGTAVNMGFYPLPPNTTTGGVMTVQYAQMPTNLVNNTDIPFNGQLYLFSYHDLLVDYASGTLWLIQGAPDLAKPYLDLLNAKLDNFTKNLGTMPNYNPAMTGFRGPRQ